MKDPFRRAVARVSRYFFYRHYRTAYKLSRFLGSFSRPLKPDDPDLVFVVHEKGRGWILEAIAREIAQRFDGTWAFHYSSKNLPSAKAYFFSHYSLVPHAYKKNPSLWGRKVFAWYTHPRDDIGSVEDDLLYILNHATRIFCTCTAFVRMLRDKGIDAERLTCFLGGADPALFLPHERGGGKVGFCTAYYARKSPDRIFEIVRRMPHRRFLLVGPGWHEYERFAELCAMPNFEHVEGQYRDYPALYAQMDVFVSPAQLEGGPIPLIEAMTANVVPVASRTGFAPDIIRHGENGYLFDTSAPPDVVCELIERAFVLKGDIRSTVLAYSWDRFAEDVLASMGFQTSPRVNVASKTFEKEVEQR